MGRIFASLLILLFAGSPLVLSGEDAVAPAHAFAIRAAPVVFDASDITRDRAGELRFLAGWALSSDDARFGGISAMALDGDGFIAIGDAGGVFRFAIDAGGLISRAEIAMLPDGPQPEHGGPLQKRDRDAESLVYDASSGLFWVGFERANAIWRYGPRLTDAQAHNAPGAMNDWPDNGGPEAMVRLADGRFLIFSEAGDGPNGSREALLFSGDPSVPGAEPMRLGYRPPDGFQITDAALLPDGRLLILNRRFTVVEGVSAIVMIADLAGLAEGTVIEGRLVARLEPPLTIDNMEALTVTREAGRTIVWMASDDNFNPLQRTLLLKFELVAPR